MKHIVIDARIRRASTGKPVARLLEHLQSIDSDHRYTVLLEKGDPWQPKKDNFTVEFARYPIFSLNPLHQFLYAGQLYRLKADLVHFTLTPQQPLFYFKPFVTFTHDLGMLTYARAGRLPQWVHSLRMSAYRLLLWHAHRRAKHVITPTQYVADAVNKYHLFTNRKTTVALEASEPPLPTKATHPKSPPKEFIMYTGSSFPHKNLERLISAFCLLKEHHPQLQLVLVGKREYYSKKLEAWARKTTDPACFKDIIFTGFIPDQELKWYYEHARAYVFTSLNEGFGLPPLEAMVHGCPVASSNATCIPEVLGDAAHYFDPSDIHEIAQKTDEVISDNILRNKLIAHGHKNTARFSWNTFAQQHADLFASIVGQD